MVNVIIKLGFLFILVLCGTTACQNSQPASATEIEAKTKQSQKATIKMQSDLGIQKEHLQMIIDECTQIDITFNDMPFTMNQSSQNAIISDLSYIDAKYYNEIPGDCLPMARKVYYGKDGVLLECDLYFSENCLYFVFIKDEIPLFANGINDKGINFYNGVLTKVGQLKQ